MAAITLEPVSTQSQIDTLCAIAKTVWHETYDDLLPPGQPDRAGRQHTARGDLRPLPGTCGALFRRGDLPGGHRDPGLYSAGGSGHPRRLRKTVAILRKI